MATQGDDYYNGVFDGRCEILSILLCYGLDEGIMQNLFSLDESEMDSLLSIANNIQQQFHL